MHIAIVGTGYVGLVTGACFAEFGVSVTCVDKDEQKIAALQAGRPTIYEPGLETLISKGLREGRLKFTTNLREAVEQSLVIFIAVGTPSAEDGAADLSQVEEVAEQIGKYLNGYKVIVTKSTVPAGTGAMVRRIIGENAKCRFSVASNPEFLREGAAIEDFMRPDRIVIGCSDPEAIAILKDLYSPLYLIDIPFVITSVETAELIKYASNAFLATKISFINEMSILCDRLGCDVYDVARAMGLDRRIGPEFLHPGPGYGGSCFPKDTRALYHLGRTLGCDLKIVNAVIEVNTRQQERMIEKIVAILDGEVHGKKVGVLGLAFKPNTDDIRESPAIYIVSRLVALGAIVKATDPAAIEPASRVLTDVTFCKDEYETAEGTELLVFLTEWNKYRKLDFEKIKSLMQRPAIADLRNIYEPDYLKRLGFAYVGVGR
ncbi:MAG: UDP-glucose/GDP-mannose dehydrogenase family protein [Acidobacteriota bacterium]|nr:UDP-glucose/GDP-mannose dehydrogenase family protein [Blastocatellia bacterium]MDW8411458.1 UDP-glucose/GDP-mannose dehydrogenase family protein [Acidobacteriota bacterium]